jgi:ferric-dicitrate binding protein FerR (iron transport regulator)
MSEKLQFLLRKQAESQLSLEEQIELSEQMADPENKATEQMMHDDWKVQLKSDVETLSNYQALLDRVHHRIRLNENDSVLKPGWWMSFQRIAAILIVPLLLSFLGYLYFQSTKQLPGNSYAEIQCPLGMRTKFQLPDGSTGYLNSGSTLKYQVSFSSERKVQLTGEAFFDVVHNEKIPFHVNTRNLDIKVLGTTFNVIANSDESNEEVILQTGKVDISSSDGKQLTVLKPNEKVTLDTKRLTYDKKEVEASQYTSWKEGKLVFRNENMQQVARRLSRWYNADVVVDDRQLDNYTFHATFVDEPLDEVLKLLSITTPLSFQEEKRESNANGVFEKRKVVLRIDKSKISKFK